MSTSNYSTPIAQASDANFRTWITAVSGKLDLYLPVTVDTGQVNLGTVTRPALNTAGGYQIRRMNDTMQATAPIFIKVEYGSGAANDRPAIWITVGTGSNGSGTITGIFFARKLISGSDTGPLASTVTNYPSFFCGIDGAFAMTVKVGCYSSTLTASVGVLSIQRSTDASGTPTADGAIVHSSSQSGGITAACTGFVSGAVYTASAAFCVVPFAMTATLVGGGPQVFNHSIAMPEIRTCAFSVTALSTEIGDLTQFAATPVGLTSHNFLSVGAAGGGASTALGTATHRFCMIYE